MSVLHAGEGRPLTRAVVDTDEVGLTPEAIRELIHNLRVHQIELESQNEELRLIHQQLEASRAKYVELYDQAPVGYLTLSAAGSIKEANLPAAALLGMRRARLVGQPLNRFVLPLDQDIYHHHRRALVEAGGLQVCELRLVRSDGEYRWVQIEATATRDADDVLAFRAIVSDISARKRAEATLRASETRHRTLFEKSHDALMTLASPDWRFTSGNAATLSMLGALDEQDFISRAPSAYAPDLQPDGSASVELAAAAIETALREGSCCYTWTFRSLAGKDFPTTVLLTRLEIDGHPLLQATVRDETEVRRLQALLSQADRVTSMGMLAAGVAHEINNPLTYVLYNNETLAAELPKVACAIERCVAALRHSFGEKRFQTVFGDDVGVLHSSSLNAMIERAREAFAGTQRIRTITKTIGTFSRVESTERSRVDLNYAIECAMTMVRNDIRFRAKLVVDFGQLPEIWASEGKLSQVFLNLLINASQAIEEGNIADNQIRIRTWVEGNDVFAEVEDTGKGISEENLAHIFEPFFTTKPVGIGSGLGLPICRSIITEFGGELNVESEIGRGTRFLVRLPIRLGMSEAPHAIPGDIEPVRGRILIVDDELAIRSGLARMLGVDHEIVTADSGVAARGILEHDQAFDVILCDLMMPDMTGMDLHKWLSIQHPLLVDQLVFMTGGAFTPKAAEYLASIGNLQLEKPYELKKLRKLLFGLVAQAKHVH